MERRRRSRRLRDKRLEDSNFHSSVVHARLESLNALIKSLSPGTRARTVSRLNLLRTVHKTRQRKRATARERDALKAKAAKDLQKRIKGAKLNKENGQVVTALLDRFPLDVALLIAKDRQTLQKIDKELAKEKRKLKKEIRGLETKLKGTESTIKMFRDELASLHPNEVRKRADAMKGIREWDKRKAFQRLPSDNDDWIDHNYQAQRTVSQLKPMESRRDEQLSKLASLKSQLAAL